MALGWLLLALLTSFAAVDALVIARRSAPSGRAELAMLALTSFYALVGGPVLLLGYLNVLTATSLALTSLSVSATTLWILARGRGVRATLDEGIQAGLEICRMHVDGLREAARARSFVLVGLIWAGAVIALAFVLTVLVPFASWDGFYYHEPMVGYAIQNHGFRMVPLPPSQPVQSINGYPRLCESMSLWFVIFTDKTLVELPNDLAGPGLMWSVYALARRYADRVTAMGWAAVLLLMPAVWTQLCHSYIDLQVAYFILVATYYATRPECRIRDAVCSTLAMALLIQSKNTALAWIPPIALVAYGRLLVHHVRARPRAAIAVIAGGTTAVGGLAALTLVRNYLAFGNPLWPITYDSATLGIHWPGLATLRHMAPELPLSQFLRQTFTVPQGGVSDVIARGYGYAIPWVVAPIGLVAVAAALVLSARDLLSGKARGARTNLALVLFPALVGARATPSVDIARYNVHLVVAIMLATAWLVSRRSWLRAREGLVAAAIVLSIIPFFWMKGWGWYWVSTKDLGDRLRRPLSAPHEYVDTPTFDLLGRQRSIEIGPGDRVAFDQDIDFPGALYNFTFSNHVHYVPSTMSDTYLARIDAYDPEWVAVGGASLAQRLLLETGRWELVGQITAASKDVVFRRRRTSP